MCEITSDNFDIKFQEINYNLQKANYVAIDTEFTGLHVENSKPSLTDTADQRYKKLKKSVQLFNVIQIGLCTFRYCNEQKIFITDTYNFYLFPRNYGFNIEINSLFQTSAIEFLCKYDFDFNKLTYKGISYMNNKQQKLLEAKLNKQIFFAGIERDLDEKLLQKICSEITDWLLHATIGECFELSEIKNLNTFVIHKELRNRFDSIWTHDEDSKVIIEKISKEKRAELNKSDNQNEIRKMIDTLLGFTKIFRLLVQYKKPLIFHNGFMDLLFIYEKFYEPLPNTIVEFKRNINQLFPLIYDTKHISLECKRINKDVKEMYENTILESLFTSLNREVAKKCALYLPSIKHSSTSSDYLINAHPHEAGYDAFMTGSVFLKLAHTLAYYDSKNCYNIRANNMNDYFLIMKSFENKIKLIKASLDHVNLNGQDPKPFKLKTLIVKSKSSSLSVFELIKAFSSIGDSEVIQISKNSARVTVDSYSSDRLSKYIRSNKQYEFKTLCFWDKMLPYLNNSLGFGLLAIGLVFMISVKKIF